MRYWKHTDGEYIIAIGTGAGNVEIPHDEYVRIMAVMLSRPLSPDKGYKLKADLTWEEYDLPTEDADE